MKWKSGITIPDIQTRKDFNIHGDKLPSGFLV